MVIQELAVVTQVEKEPPDLHSSALLTSGLGLACDIAVEATSVDLALLKKSPILGGARH